MQCMDIEHYGQEDAKIKMLITESCEHFFIGTKSRLKHSEKKFFKFNIRKGRVA